MPTYQIYLNESDFDGVVEIAKAYGYSAKTANTTLVALLRAIFHRQLFLSDKPLVEVPKGMPNEHGLEDFEYKGVMRFLSMLTEEINVEDLVDFLHGLLPKRELGTE